MGVRGCRSQWTMSGQDTGERAGTYQAGVKEGAFQKTGERWVAI